MIFVIRRWQRLLLAALLPACQAPHLAIGLLPAVPPVRHSRPQTVVGQVAPSTMMLMQPEAIALATAPPAAERGRVAAAPITAHRPPHRRQPAHLLIRAATVSLSVTSPSVAPEPKKSPAFVNAGLFLALGAVLLLAAGLVLAIGLGSWVGLAALLGGIAGSIVAVMAAVFSATAHNLETKSRFNLLKLAGLLALPGGVALGLAVGGLLGVGLGLLGLAVGTLLIGTGIIAGVPDAAPPLRQ